MQPPRSVPATLFANNPGRKIDIFQAIEARPVYRCSNKGCRRIVRFFRKLHFTFCESSPILGRFARRFCSGCIGMDFINILGKFERVWSKTGRDLRVFPIFALPRWQSQITLPFAFFPTALSISLECQKQGRGKAQTLRAKGMWCVEWFFSDTQAKVVSQVREDQEMNTLCIRHGRKSLSKDKIWHK